MRAELRLVIRIIVAMSSLLQGCAYGPGGPATPAVDLEPAEAQPAVSPSEAAEIITSAAMKAHIAYLASDELRGRDTPSEGLELAAEYVAGAFREAGLEPGGDEGTYFQRYEFVRRSLRTEGLELSARGSGEERTFEYATDYFLIATRPDTITGEGLFVGSLDAVAEGFPADVAGRIAFVMMPPHMGAGLIRHLQAASRVGVVAVGLILPPQVPRSVIAGIAEQVRSGFPIPIAAPAIGLQYDAAAEIFEAANLNLEGLRERMESGDFEPVEMSGTPLRLEVGMNEERSRPANVAGIVRGSDPELADSYVVLTAHYDHLGVGAPDATGDSIYNGADDDASGTALLMEVAKAFGALGRAPRRSVVFLAVSGEERGLVGSLHWVRQPTIPLDGAVANLNFDMIGRNAPDTLIAVGEEFSSLGPLARQIAATHADLGLVVAPDPDPSEQAFLRSDQVAFVHHDIPALALTTWLHADYHMPSDEADRIDEEKAARVGRFAFYLTLAVADDPVSPAWNPGSLAEVRRILEDSPFF